MDQIFMFFGVQLFFYVQGLWTIFDNFIISMLIIILNILILYFLKVKYIIRYSLVLIIMLPWVQVISIFINNEISRISKGVILNSKTLLWDYLLIIVQLIILLIIIVVSARNYIEKRNDFKEIKFLILNYSINILLITSLIYYNFIQVPKLSLL
ncbi:hypothetical protein [Clostridium intestinale]|uniref:hypothetical protein n=1 Tax=Clostridium intestinale TaxID=36845 RepID=UPI002DD6B82F|nr:hypothetical protein [Clostridium intestinale]WRY52291.1 hypothetical protein P8F83_03645 [Clostridium intestinale]